MNLTVIAANGWKMPVIGMTRSLHENEIHSHWTPETKFSFLCDRFKFRLVVVEGIASIGDFAILLGLILLYASQR